MTEKLTLFLLSIFLVITFCQRFAVTEPYDSEECGIQYTSDRITGGTITKLDEFPWMGLIAYMSGNGVVTIGCGGVLINHKYILTAAHCVKGTAARQLGKIVAVRLGEYDLKSAIDCNTDEIEETCAPAPVDYFVESVHAHPDYKAGSSDRRHDIALIRLNHTVKYSAYVRPICLPTSTFKKSLLNPGESLIVCGWGKTETQEAGSGIKLKASIPVIAKKGCKSTYSAQGVNVDDSQICAGGGKSDTCKGDSGGPLMAVEKSNTNDERWYTVGVVSFGSEKCGSEGVPAIYTATRSYSNWINSIMKP